jgi:hypothetical protein
MNILVACGLMSGRGINDHVSETEKKEAPEGICQVTGEGFDGVDDVRICMSTAVSIQIICYTGVRRRVDLSWEPGIHRAK